MALEDVCGFIEKSFLYLEDPATSVMTGCYNLNQKRQEKSEEIPHCFSMPHFPRDNFSISRNAAPLSLKNLSVTVHRPFPLTHGTTTLGFIFQGGVLAAADTRASAGGLVACPAVHKITPIHSHLVVTSSGSGADCQLWERILIREIRLYQLRHGRRLSIRGTAKLLSFMLHPFKGTDVCVALTLCGWDKEEGDLDCSQNWEDTSMTGSPSGVVSSATRSLYPNCGPQLIYVCSDGARLQGQVFSVGSGSPYAYSVLDGSLSWSLSKKEAISLAKDAVFRATHRDAYSGNNVDIFLITAQGWSQRQREDLKEEYYRDMEKKVQNQEEQKVGQQKI